MQFMSSFFMNKPPFLSKSSGNGVLPGITKSKILTKCI